MLQSCIQMCCIDMHFYAFMRICGVKNYCLMYFFHCTATHCNSVNYAHQLTLIEGSLCSGNAFKTTSHCIQCEWALRPHVLGVCCLTKAWQNVQLLPMFGLPVKINGTTSAMHILACFSRVSRNTHRNVCFCAHSQNTGV